MEKYIFRFAPLFVAWFYGGVFAYFISSQTGEEIYGMFSSSRFGAGWTFLFIFMVLGLIVQAIVEVRTYLQHRTPRQSSLREAYLQQEVEKLKGQVMELHKELAKRTPMAM